MTALPRYDMTRADKIDFTNRVRHWIDLLGLYDWVYHSIEFVDTADFQAQVMMNVDGHSFHLQVRTYWEFPVCAQNIDYLICHEMLHLVLGPLWKAGNDHTPPGVDRLIERVEHEAIARLTRALAPMTLVVRGIPDIEEVPTPPEQVATPEGDRGTALTAMEALAKGPNDWTATYGARSGGKSVLAQQLQATMADQREHDYQRGYEEGARAAGATVESVRRLAFKEGYEQATRDCTSKIRVPVEGNVDAGGFAACNDHELLRYSDYTQGLGVRFGARQVGTLNRAQLVALMGWASVHGWPCKIDM